MDKLSPYPATTTTARRSELGESFDAVKTATALPRPARDKSSPTTEQVARVVAAIPAIGQAYQALTTVGWRAVIAANRITVNDSVIAQFIGAAGGGHGGARWVIYRIAGGPPVWVVGAEPERW